MSTAIGNSGRFAVSECTTNIQVELMAMPVSIQHSAELYQSMCSPRSSSSWKDASAVASRAQPNRSNGRRVPSSRGINHHSPPKQTTPSGRLIRNTQRQLKFSVSQPPRIGPIIGPTITLAPNSAIARGCSEGRLILKMMLCPSGPSEAPPIPCKTRNATIWGMLVAIPHSTDETTNRVMDDRNSMRMPSRSASQPLIGVIIAAAMI